MVLIGLVLLEVWLLFIVNFVWIVVYDIMYVMVDRDDDLKIGVKLMVILFVSYDRYIIFLFNVLFIVIFVFIGMSNYFGLFYWLGLVVVIGFLFY